MRGRTALCGALIVVGAGAVVVPAAPVKSTAPVPSAVASNPTLHAEAMQFAQTLHRLFALIEENYIRPIGRADLADAVVRGLYEAVREPLPADLPHEIRRADEYQLIALLTRVRESLGQHEALRGKRALLVAMHALPRALDAYSGVTPSRDQDPLGEDGNLTGVGLEFPVAPPQPNFR